MSTISVAHTTIDSPVGGLALVGSEDGLAGLPPSGPRRPRDPAPGSGRLS